MSKAPVVSARIGRHHVVIWIIASSLESYWILLVFSPHDGNQNHRTCWTQRASPVRFPTRGILDRVYQKPQTVFELRMGKCYEVWNITQRIIITVKPVLNGNIFRSHDYHSIPWLNGNLASAEKCFGPLRFHLSSVGGDSGQPAPLPDTLSNYQKLRTKRHPPPGVACKYRLQIALVYNCQWMKSFHYVGRE
jgi:hypothetical protein